MRRHAAARTTIEFDARVREIGGGADAGGALILVVVAEGTVRTQRATGEFVNLVFSDVFEMRDGKISRLISYMMEVKADGV